MTIKNLLQWSKPRLNVKWLYDSSDLWKVYKRVGPPKEETI